MAELVDLTWGKEIYLGIDLNEDQREENDVDDQPTPTIKLPQARDDAQLLSNLAMDHPSEFLVVDMMNMQSFMNKLHKMSISNTNKHHQKTINSYLCSV